MKLLVFGRTGQVARELSILRPDATFLGREDADLLNPASCARCITGSEADVVVNVAAYTAVDRAEEDEVTATRVNGDSPTAMARAAASMGKPFLHVSTDYVFDGSDPRPRKPDDTPCPINAYGRSKLAGERGVQAAGGPYTVLRTSWVFSAHGHNFVKTMLRLAETRSTLNVVDDQVGGPTSAAAIASALLTLAQAHHRGEARSGTYHLSGAPDATWAVFAREVFAQSGRACEVQPIATSSWPTPARRPLSSRLSCEALERDHGIARPFWRSDLAEVLAQLGVAYPHSRSTI